MEGRFAENYRNQSGGSHETDRERSVMKVKGMSKQTITDETILMTYDEICNNEDECRPLYLISQEIADDLGMDFFSVTGLIVAERFIR